MKTTFACGCILLSGSLFAATDVTSSLEYLFAPMESRYGTSADYASSRGVHCMEYLDGRIYIGGGNWDDNTGPVPLISILPGATPSWTNEYSAGAEHIESFKKFSDGRIWTRATDPKEGNPNYGYFFAKYPGGEWVRCPLGKIDWNPAHQLNGAELYTHEWDFCDYKGKFYFTGFGIGGSQYWLNGDETFANKMGSVTTGQTNGYYRYSRITEMKGKKVTTEEGLDRERFMTLMPFTNGCAAVTYHWYESRKPEVNQCYFWRRNESTGLFAREDCSWDAFLNGYDNVDRELAGSTYGWWIYFRKATPFNGRVYYIVTPGCSMNLPIGFFSAAMDGSGNITSQRHAFDGGHGHVIDIAVVGGAMYVMTVKYFSPLRSCTASGRRRTDRTSRSSRPSRPTSTSNRSPTRRDASISDTARRRSGTGAYRSLRRPLKRRDRSGASRCRSPTMTAPTTEGTSRTRPGTGTNSASGRRSFAASPARA